MKTLADEYSPGDVIGSSGIEAQYEETLRGQKGAEFMTVNVRGQVIGKFENGRNDVPAVEGNDLHLTMDFGLPGLAESLMVGKRGAVVALDPRDGGVLAMVSEPDYNPASLSGVTPPSSGKRSTANSETPLFNRATLSRYPPGSTFKMILAHRSARESKTVSPSWRITCGGAFRFGNKVFKDLHVHGSVDMLAAIQRSCNVYFYQLMLKTGWTTGHSYGDAIRFRPSHRHRYRRGKHGPAADDAIHGQAVWPERMDEGFSPQPRDRPG